MTIILTEYILSIYSGYISEVVQISVKHVFLAMLTTGDMHGYEIKLAYDSLLLNEAELNFGQVYSTLSRLERDGFIQVSDYGDGEKKIYAITQKGRADLDRWLSEQVSGTVLYDDMSYKLAVIEKLNSEKFAASLQSYRELLISQLQRLLRKKRELPKESIGLRLLLERCVFKLEADIKWTDRCLDILSEL